MDIIKFAKTYILTALTAAAAVTAPSCGEPMFDNEGDCEVTHSIRFCYNMNLKWADAFPSEVKSVHLYAFDRKGIFLKEYTGAGEALTQPGYAIPLDLPADSYRFVAWCGLENEGAEEESFTVPQPKAGVTTIDELTSTLNTKSSAAYAAYSDSELHFLYHGYLEATLEDHHDGRHYEHTIYLTKDTNHVRIILQELTSDEDMNPDDYSVCIKAANGRMGYDNALIGNAEVTYLPWDKTSDEVGVGKVDVDDGELKIVKGVVIDLSVARLMEADKDDLMLSIIDETSAEKTVIAEVPLIQYALLSRKYYEKAYGHQMDDQEFLDREDEYVLTFFLEKNRWLKSYIYIHSWRIIIHEYEVGA